MTLRPGFLALALGLLAGGASAALPVPAPIAPINAPFPMPQLQRPVFAAHELAVTDFGAVGDGVTLNIGNIQRAIDACHAAGGGTVIIPAGRWLTTPIELRSRVRLHLAEGAEVVFTDEKKYYYAGMGVFDTPPKVGSQGYAPEQTNLRLSRPLLSAYDCEDIAVTGSGRLEGQGRFWWPLHKVWLAKQGNNYPADVAARAVRGLDPALDYARPVLIQVERCRNVLLEGFTAVNSPFWTINPVVCQNLIARKITIRAVGVTPDGHAPNTDGINPESCRNVLIEDCDIETGDDSVAIKSGLDEAGRKRGLPSENIVVRHLHGKRIAIGSDMSGGVRDVLIHDCRLIGDMNSVLHFKARRGRGGLVENIHVRDIEAGSVFGSVVLIDMEYWTHVVPAPPEPVSERTPHYRNLFFSNIRSTAASPKACALFINGLPEAPLENLRFEHLRLDSGRGIVCRHAQGVTFKDVALTATGPFLTVAGAESRDIGIDAEIPGRRAAVVFEDGAKVEAVRKLSL